MAEPGGTELTPRQAEILERVLELVREGGLGGLTTRRIAERVGFTEAALYRHFPTKGALVLGLMDRLEGMLLGPIREIARRGELSVAERLERIVRHHVQLVLDLNSLPILLLAEASLSEDPELLARMRSIFGGYLSLLEGLVREGQERGELVRGPDPEGLALLLVGAPAALAIRHRLVPDARAEARFRAAALPVLLRALAAPEKGAA